MALGSLPPWLQINPRDFLLATQAGAQLGNTIAEQTTKAFENQQRLKMEEEQNQTKQAQQAIQNAMTRLAADRLENYRQQEAAARQQQLGIENKRLGSLDIQQQRADEIARHNAALEDAKFKAMTNRPQAGITTLPEAPGYTFLQNPSGALTPLQRPPRLENELAKQHLQLSALNAMAPKGSETEDMPSYQSRTNAVGGILRSLNPGSPLDIPTAPKDPKQRKTNSVYKTPKGVFTWTGSGWMSAGQSQEPDDGE